MEDLTAREEEVLQLVSEGVSTKDIAARLWIAVATVRNHIYNAMVKLDAHNKIQVVNAWKEHRKHPERRILAYCRRSGIVLTAQQQDAIRAVFLPVDGAPGT